MRSSLALPSPCRCMDCPKATSALHRRLVGSPALTKDRVDGMPRRVGPRRSTVTMVPVLLTGSWLAWTAQPCAATQVSVQLAQGAADMLELGKEALGLGEEETSGGHARTGIENGVPFLVRFRGTVDSLEPGASVRILGMRMGAVREVQVIFDPATASFDVSVVIELDPAPFVAGEPTEAAAEGVYGALGAMVRNGLRGRARRGQPVPRRARGGAGDAARGRPGGAAAEGGGAAGDPDDGLTRRAADGEAGARGRAHRRLAAGADGGRAGWPDRRRAAARGGPRAAAAPRQPRRVQRGARAGGPATRSDASRRR